MQIHALNIYPIKALAGIGLDKALLTAKGLATPLQEGLLHDRLLHDRQWMLINPAGQMVTQRQLPELAMLQPVIEAGQLCLTAPGLPPIAVTGAQADAPQEPSQVWKTPVQVQALPGLTAWLAAAVPGAQLRLVQLAAPRPMLTERFGGLSETHFADAAPYLVANTASLAALNQALINEGQTPVDERRFRANIWLAGLAAFTEHQVPVLNVPQGQIRMVDHCQRCSVITVDPERGVFCPNAKPFKTLAGLNAMPNQPKAPAFGVNAVYEEREHNWLAVGDFVN